MTLTTRQKAAKTAVLAWCAKYRKEWRVCSVSHVYPVAFVIGYAAPLCLVVSRPWTEAEPHMAEFCRDNPLDTVREFDSSLRAGDWCAVAYVSTESRGTLVAVPLQAEAKAKRRAA
jgi:hypothetical protein